MLGTHNQYQTFEYKNQIMISNNNTMMNQVVPIKSIQIKNHDYEIIKIRLYKTYLSKTTVCVNNTKQNYCI